MENGHDEPEVIDSICYKHTSDAASGKNHETLNDGVSSAGHKRSLSGSILSKLSFLRPSTEARNTPTSQADGVQDAVEGSRAQDCISLSTAEQKRGRKRKGSLRKTAMLGTGRLKLEGREKRSSPLEMVQSAQPDTIKSTDVTSASIDTTSANSADDLPTPRQSYEKDSLPYSNGSLHNSLNLAHNTGSEEILPHLTLNRKPTLGDMSTTDDEDALTFSRSPNAHNFPPNLAKPIGPESYFPSSSLQRRRSSNKPPSSSRAKSPLASLPLSESALAPSEPDYSNTEWWGWVVLVVTWIVFVVGMGSCLGVWSWAWDVGETPYAPPELSDDPTLPIVGYYPALIILTAVMAWVWVVVAWVGMKYFRHAKISGED
ncbi:hypothetical protein MMC19_001636 [Ptychographa xylographoides]|nr:hypothetical protein [Ptychographa xylographoides]